MCVKNSTTQHDVLKNLIADERLLVVPGNKTVVEAFGNDECQVYASGIVERTSTGIQAYYQDIPYIGTVPFTRESLALVTREGDVVLSKWVDAVVNCIIYADEQGITQNNSQAMPEVNLFKSLIGTDAMFRNIIAAVGNYQEIWDRHTNPGGLQRGGRNLLNRLPLGPTLMTVLTWNQRPPIENPG